MPRSSSERGIVACPGCEQIPVPASPWGEDHPPLANWLSLGFFPKEGRFEEKVPVILVIIMVVAWVIILGPSLLRRRARGGGVNSISHFHRQLRVLEHSAPEPIVAPAYRLRAVAGSAGVGDRSAADGPEAAPVLTVVGANDLPRPALAFLGEDPGPAAPSMAGRPGYPAPPRGAAAPSRPGPRAGGARGSRRPEASISRRRACRRRRDTLGVLSLTVVLSALIGLVAGVHLVWAVTALAGVALVGYVALLVHLRREAEEREHTLAYLRPASGANLPPDLAEPSAHVGGRYAHPAYQAAAAH
jgi:hypothetical protein